VTSILTVSQNVLSFRIPFGLARLLLITRRANLMGSPANRRITIIAGALACALIITLNGYLLAVSA
jgi:manganese transport protein